MLRRLLLLLLAATPLAASAEAPKVFRYAFEVAETSFDPHRVSDVYSNIVNQAHVRLAAHLRLPRAPAQAAAATRSAAMPEVSADGTTYTLRVQAGHLLRRRSGVQGQQARAGRRRLRLLDQAPARPEGARLAAGRGGALHPRRRGGRDRGAQGEPVRLRRADRGAARRSTATPSQVKLNQPLFIFIYNFADCRITCAVAREVVEHYGEDVGSHPVGTGPYRLGVLEALVEDGASSANPDYREEFFEGAAGRRRRPRRRRSCAQFKGKRLPDGRPRRDLDHRGDAAALARRSSTASWTSSSRCPRSSPTRRCPTTSSRRNLRQARHRHGAGARARPHLQLLQHERPGGRRLHAGEGGAAPRDLARATRPTTRSTSSARARRSRRRRRRAPGVAGYDPDFRTSGGRVRRAQGQGAARHVRLRRSRRRRLPRDARRQPARAQGQLHAHRARRSSSTSCGSAAWTTSACA